MSDFIGQVYIICFDRPYKSESGRTVRHYVGFATDLNKRIAHHKANTGAKLIRALNLAGIDWKVVRVFKNVSREIERKIKNYKKTDAFCPNCFSSHLQTLSTPKGYIEPPEQWKRAYKLIRLKCGTFHASRITVSQVEAMKRLSKRLHVGDELQIGDKIYKRQNARRGESWELLEIVENAHDDGDKWKTAQTEYLEKLNRIPPQTWIDAYVGKIPDEIPPCKQCGGVGLSLDEKGYCWACDPPLMCECCGIKPQLSISNVCAKCESELTKHVDNFSGYGTNVQPDEIDARNYGVCVCGHDEESHFNDPEMNSRFICENGDGNGSRCPCNDYCDADENRIFIEEILF